MVSLAHVEQAKKQIQEVVKETPCEWNANWSERFNADIFFKREDLQAVRSYKIRGAFNKISSLNEDQKLQGVVCASAGNHAQGVAYSCQLLKIKGTIFMPATTPMQKVKQVQLFGKSFVDIVLEGDTFDDAYAKALHFSRENQNVFIPPFDDEKVIAGQGTIGLELLTQVSKPIDYLFVPIGGGGLVAGLITVFKALSPNTKIIGVEPSGAPSMKTAIEQGENTTLDQIDKFVDGAAVKRVGELNFEICKSELKEICLVPEGKVCTTILQLYNEEAMVVEPAGALTLAALDFYREAIQGKTVVCIISGSNNDITRTEEIKERSLFYEGLKHYFLVQFPQRPGALKDFVTKVLGPTDDITYFQFTKKNSRESGPVVIGLELTQAEDLEHIKEKMNALHFSFTYINDDSLLYSQLIG